jgi:hypothetical protein
MRASLLATALFVGAVLAVMPATPAAASPDAATTAVTGRASTASQPLCTTRRGMTVSDGGRAYVIYVPASRTGNRSCLIGDGNVGCRGCSGIAQLQRSINDCHTAALVRYKVSRLKEDGIWGPHTRQAVVAVQRWVNANVKAVDIRVDGIYGPGTRNRMYHSSDGKGSAAKSYCARFHW